MVSPAMLVAVVGSFGTTVPAVINTLSVGASATVGVVPAVEPIRQLESVVQALVVPTQ